MVPIHGNGDFLLYGSPRISACVSGDGSGDGREGGIGSGGRGGNGIGSGC
jgi:hypothetical protein